MGYEFGASFLKQDRDLGVIMHKMEKHLYSAWKLHKKQIEYLE